MRRRQVRRGRAAYERRYQDAVDRQVALVRAARWSGRPHLYADPRGFLRPGDTLDRFTLTGVTIHTGEAEAHHA